MKSTATPAAVPFVSKAFTLMEMMIVLAIIAMLIAVGAVTLGHIREHGEIVAAEAQINTIKTAILDYRTMNRQLPRQLEDLVNPPKEARVKTPFASQHGITDPWGKTFQLRVPGKKGGGAYDIYSMGPDMQDGTDDDVRPVEP
jgi:general secretion pathway protein G